MKRILISIIGLLLVVAPVVQAQDAALEERLSKINGHIQDLLAAQADQQKRIAALAKDLENLREQTSKPVGNFASQEAVDKLVKTVQEVDQKRIADNEKILATLETLKKTIAASRTERAPSKSKSVDQGGADGGPQKGYEYVIQSGDTLSAISLAYRQKGVKVTPEQILKANRGLKATSLQVGQKIFIPGQ